MNKIRALFLLTLHTAWSTRVIPTLIILLAGILILFPLHLQGDGTASGRIRILLEYTLGAVAAVIAFSTAWSACSAVAGEAADRRIQLVLTKPVHPIQLWLGKWLGLLLFHTVALLTAGLVLYLALLASLPDPSAAPADAANWEWAHYQLLKPRPESVEADLERRLAQARRNGVIPAEGPLPAKTLRFYRTEARRAQSTLPPNGQFTWTFDLPPQAGQDSHPLRLRYRFDASRWERQAIPLEWTLQTSPETPPLTLSQQAYSETPTELRIPLNLPPETTTLRISVANRALTPPTTLVFEPDQGVNLLVTHRDNGLNFLRGLLVLTARIAFFAAVGLTAGCLFSTPTALFFTLFVWVLISLGGSIQQIAESGIFGVSHHGEAVSAGGWDAPILAIHQFFSRLLAPIQSLDVIPRLGGQERIAGSEVGRAWLIYGLLWSGFFFLAGLAALRRREFGKPENL